MTINDPIIAEFRAALDEVYGERVTRVILYGSRARGDNRSDSDYDIAVFLDGPNDFGQEVSKLARIETAILDSTGAIINSLPFPASAYGDKTGFMQEVRREGLEL